LGPGGEGFEELPHETDGRLVGEIAVGIEALRRIPVTTVSVLTAVAIGGVQLAALANEICGPWAERPASS
jgi:hypothetical protein